MNLYEAQKKLETLFREYWTGATVAWGNTDMVRPTLPFVLLTLHSITRPQHPCSEYSGGQRIDRYHVTARIDANLYTKGKPVTADAYFNTAVSDMSRFVNYLNSERAAAWCAENGIAVLAEGQCLDATAILGDKSREFRALQQVTLSYVETATGYAAVSGEDGFNKSVSGGGSQELADMDAGYFTDVEFTQEESNE